MWCAVRATVHFSAAVVFLQSASVSDSRRVVAASTLASNSRASDSPLAPIVHLPGLVSPPINERGPSRSTGSARLRVDRAWAMAAPYNLVTSAACQPAAAMPAGNAEPERLGRSTVDAGRERAEPE